MSDTVAGNTYFRRYDTGASTTTVLSIGRDTLVGAGLFAVGLVPEAISDTAINVKSLVYSIRRLTADEPNQRLTFTLRCTDQETRP